MSPVRFLVAPHLKSRSRYLERLSFFYKMIKKNQISFYETPKSLATKIATFSDKPVKKAIILTDENVSTHCLPLILSHLNEKFEFLEIIEVDPGESSKELRVVGQIWTQLLESSFEKKDLLINLGGGVISDLGGFAGSTYKRGLNFINVPTTLMSMVDASIGGKNGIDHSGIKNAVGTFSTPDGVLIYSQFLHTLSKRELKSGFAEMLKHALIADEVQWQKLSEINEITAQSIIPFIPSSTKIKEKIVKLDYLENGKRKLLNYGHTIGHAIEAWHIERKRSITHGEAIAYGMQLESKVALTMKKISLSNYNLIVPVLAKYFPIKNRTLPSFDQLMKYMKNDKKNYNGEFRMSFPISPGEAIFDVPVPEQIINEVIS